MLYYYRIDLSQGIDVAKSNNSKKCIICHYWLFNHGFKFLILYVIVVIIDDIVS